MVCLAEKPSLRDASCWRVEVVNGADGERCVSFLTTSMTLYWASSSSPVIFLASASFLTPKRSTVLSPIFTSRALNFLSSSFLERDASTDQYSWGLNFWI